MIKIDGMNQAAVKAYNRIKNAVKKEVITTDKLLGLSSQEALQDRRNYMNNLSFWANPHNAAKYAKGVFKTELSKSAFYGKSSDYCVSFRRILDDSFVPLHGKNLVNIEDLITHIKTTIDAKTGVIKKITDGNNISLKRKIK